MQMVNITLSSIKPLLLFHAMHEFLSFHKMASNNNIDSAWELGVFVVFTPFLYLSPLPISVIDDADKRVVLGSDKPSDGVATSLRFPSQPGSFLPSNYGSEESGPPDGQPDSPVKTSPVSERIKALEALAAKKKEPESRTDSGFIHFKERHYEKSPIEVPTETAPPVQKKRGSTDLESPESPFEVLGKSRQGSEFEDTADWMRAHLPPVQDFEDPVDISKNTVVSEKNFQFKEVKGTAVVIPHVPAAFAGVPDAFMDSPSEGVKFKGDMDEPTKQPSVEEESEFDLSFLPTAYVWDKQEKPDTHVQPDVEPELPVSPAPPAGFDSPTLPPDTTKDKKKLPESKKNPWGGDLETPEGVEIDSSGESDDTVIEDATSTPAPSMSSSNNPAPSVPTLPTEEKEAQPVKQERKLMQVPTINVIETDEPNYSDEEMVMELEEEEEEEEVSDVVKDPVGKTPKAHEPEPEETKTDPPKTRPLETEFMEGYSPPSSPVDSDAEYSPKHKVLKSEPEPGNQISTAKTDGLQKDSKDPSSDSSHRQSEKPYTACESNDKPTPFTATPPVTTDEADFPDNDDEWSDEVQDILVKSNKPDVKAELPPHDFKSKVEEEMNTDIKPNYMETGSLSRSSFMQDDVYDRQSFGDDYDAPPVLGDMSDEKNRTHTDEPSSNDPTSQIHIDSLLRQESSDAFKNDATDLEDNEDSFPQPVCGQLSPIKYPKDPYSSFHNEPPGSVKEAVTDLKKNDVIADTMARSKALPPHEVAPKVQDTKTGQESPDPTSDPESIELDCSISGATDSFVDFMRECLKSRPDNKPEDVCQGLTSKQGLTNTGAPSSESAPAVVMDLEQERLTINALKELGSSQEDDEGQGSSSIQNKGDPNAASNQPSSSSSSPNQVSPQTNADPDSTYSKEVEAIEEWMAEVAYHLAEHVLTAILTHLSGNIYILWASGLLTSHASTTQ
ncbi:uncharacterized protein FYW47_015577 [Aplochiton taeniatus]